MVNNLNILTGQQLCSGLRGGRVIAAEALREVPRVSSDNANFARVVVGVERGPGRPSQQPEDRDPVALLEATMAHRTTI